MRVRRALTLTLSFLLAPTRGTSQGHPQVKGRTVMMMMEGMGEEDRLNEERVGWKEEEMEEKGRGQG